MACYSLSHNAEDDLGRIWLYGLQRFGLVQADQYYYGLIQHFEQIAEAPLHHPAVEHIRKGYRVISAHPA